MCTPFSRIPQAQLMRLDSFFSGALCALSGGRLPEALFMVFLLDSKGAELVTPVGAPPGSSDSAILFEDGSGHIPAAVAVAGVEGSTPASHHAAPQTLVS